jgi:hypothetical protein
MSTIVAFPLAEDHAMRAGWANIYIGLLNSQPRRFNWWRIGGLSLGIAFSILVWALLVAALR